MLRRAFRPFCVLRNAAATLAALLLFQGPIYAGKAILECTADTSTGAPPTPAGQRSRERDLPLATGPRSALLDFRFSAAAGWMPRKATLFLHLAAGPMPKRIRVGLAAEAWRESDPPAKMRARSERVVAVTPLPQGWFQADLDPTLLAPLLAGTGHGLVLRAADGEEHRIHSRETAQYGAYLVVEGERKP